MQPASRSRPHAGRTHCGTDTPARSQSPSPRQAVGFLPNAAGPILAPSWRGQRFGDAPVPHPPRPVPTRREVVHLAFVRVTSTAVQSLEGRIAQVSRASSSATWRHSWAASVPVTATLSRLFRYWSSRDTSAGSVTCRDHPAHPLARHRAGPDRPSRCLPRPHVHTAPRPAPKPHVRKCVRSVVVGVAATPYPEAKIPGQQPWRPSFGTAEDRNGTGTLTAARGGKVAAVLRNGLNIYSSRGRRLAVQICGHAPHQGGCVGAQQGVFA